MDTPFFESLVDGYIADRKIKWAEAVTPASWWKVWDRVGILTMTKFIIESLDELIPYFSQFRELPGHQKKMYVMQGIASLYDSISGQCLPTWLLPVAPFLKKLVMDQIVSPGIDWICSKYKDNGWKVVVPSLETVLQDN